MNIIEACKSGKKFRRPEWSTPGYFWEYVDGNIQDYEGCIIDEIEISDALATDYELYEEGIRPKEAGELWRYSGKFGSDLYAIGKDSTGLFIVWLNGFSSKEDRDIDNMIHNQNGWERISPAPVEDERVEIEDVVWVECNKGIHPKGGPKYGFTQIPMNKSGKLIFIPNK